MRQLSRRRNAAECTGIPNSGTGLLSTFYDRSMTIALTGTTGGIGGAVLAKLPGRHVLIGRDASTLPSGHDARQAAYGEPQMAEALTGVDTLFFVSGRESATRLHEHYNVVTSAITAGVERIVYLSFLGATADSIFTLGRQHYYTEQAIRDSGLKFTFLRDSFYQDYLVHMVGADGVIRGPGGTGRISAVSRDDVAEVAAEVLRHAADVGQGNDSKHDGVTYDVTGPEARSLAEFASELQAASGRPVSYYDETEAEAYASRAQYNAPAFEVEGWVTSYQSFAAGEMSHVSGDVERVIGRPPVSYAEFLKANPESHAELGSN
jgi:NAD(P)H dehydrogenase (quinone)